MSITSRLVVSALALSLGGGAAFAQAAGNNMNITQGPLAVGGSAGFFDADFNQSVDGGNNLNLDVQGAINTIRINQQGAGNDLDMTVSARDTSTGDYQVDYVGDDNTHKLVVNTRVQEANGFRFANPLYNLTVTGSNNTLAEEFRGGGDFTYDGSIAGDNNAVDIRRGNGGVGNWDADYSITGDSNKLGVSVGIGMNASRAFDITVDGDRNDIGYAITSPAGSSNTLTASYTGDDITSRVAQVGNLATADVTIVKVGAGAFSHNVTQIGDSTAAIMMLTANGNGSFDLTQTSDGANFAGTMTVEAAGTIVATQ